MHPAEEFDFISCIETIEYNLLESIGAAFFYVGTVGLHKDGISRLSVRIVVYNYKNL